MRRETNPVQKPSSGLGQPGHAEDAEREGVLDEAAHRAQHGAEDLAAADRRTEMTTTEKALKTTSEGGRAGAGEGIDEHGHERGQQGLQDVLENGLPHPPASRAPGQDGHHVEVSKPKYGVTRIFRKRAMPVPDDGSAMTPTRMPAG